MPTRSRRAAVKKCLFGGTLLAAGLATQAAQAQTFEFVDTDASAYTTGGGTDSFSGPGTWFVESHYSYFGYGDAEAWGTPMSMGLYAYGTTDTGGPSAYAQVNSQFTVSSDVVVTVDWYLFPFLTGFLSLTDLTNNVVLLSPHECCGSLDIPLFADRLYEYSSGTDYGYTSVTIMCPEDLDGNGVVDFGDILIVLGAWGESGGPADVDGSGTVDFGDLLVVLAAWGPC